MRKECGRVSLKACAAFGSPTVDIVFESPGLVDLLICCVFPNELHAGIFSSNDRVVAVGGGKKWLEGFFFTLSRSLSFSSFALLPQLVSSSGFSVEHLALRRSRGWGSVTFDEWIHLWLTLLLSDCLISTLYFFLHLSFARSLNPFLSLSGLCSSLKTVVADLIGLCWTLALCCISYDHLRDSLTLTSCEVQLCNIVWALLSVRTASLLQVFQVYCGDEFINYL